MELTDEAVNAINQVEYLQERMAALELALEDASWWRLSAESEREFSRDGLRQITQIARIFYLKNPLIKRGVEVQRDYVFGQGVSIRAEAAPVNAVIQTFLDDAKNKTELTSQQALAYKEVDLAVEGNLFLVLVTDSLRGRVRVRSIPFDEISDIITNPDDARAPWYYKRQWYETRYNEDGQGQITTRTAYYPDWRHMPANKPQSMGGIGIEWDAPVYHVRTGGLGHWRYGLSEVYAAIDWAKAYKEFLEDWATITRALSRFAWNLTVKGGKSGIAAAKTKLATTLGASSGESNPPPVTGSTFIGSEGAALNPVRTAGATTSAEDGRRLLLMVASAVGLPESFFGDVSVGTLATARSLDRPTELKMRSRQSLWSDILSDLCDYVIRIAVIAGQLPGTLHDEDDGTPRIELAVDPDTGEPMSATVFVEFPELLEHDRTATVNAIISAATLNGQPQAGTIDRQTLMRLLLTELGVDDVDAALDAIEQEEQPPTTIQPAEAAMLESIRELRQAITEAQRG